VAYAALAFANLYVPWPCGADRRAGFGGGEKMGAGRGPPV